MSLGCLAFRLGCLEMDLWNSQQNDEMKNGTVDRFEEAEHLDVSSSVCKA